jgi:hypothetical protein
VEHNRVPGYSFDVDMWDLKGSSIFQLALIYKAIVRTGRRPLLRRSGSIQYPFESFAFFIFLYTRLGDAEKLSQQQ